ncbi:protein cholesin [Gastrophryne carolinensis]
MARLRRKDDTQNDLNLEELSPEECRVLERKLKKERKKEEKRLKKEREALGVTEEKKDETTKPSAGDLALQYLKSWSKKRSEWKFQKTRQTWLLMNMYDPEKVPDKYFKILLDYLGGLQGNARETTIEKAEAYMKELDSSEDQEEADSQRIARVREVLQILS